MPVAGRSSSLAALVLGLSLAGLAPLPACQVPVFRYALERWDTANYQVSIVPGAGGLNPKEQELARELQSATTAGINMAVETAAAGTGQTASLVLRYPTHPQRESATPIWQAPLTDESRNALKDSPARQELRRRLLAGQSAVWIMLESGNVAKDEAANAELTKALAAAEENLKLPEGVATPAELERAGPVGAAKAVDVLQSDLPLKIEFSILRLRRDDANEAALLAMLLHLEDDLGEFANEPMAFPVFGRGRVLEPLIGKGIHEGTVVEHAGYLCGACSCEVKEQNPGMDLLLAGDWQTVAAPPPEVVKALPIIATSPAPTDEKPKPIALLLSASAVALCLGVWMLRRKA